jgi:hypothetical protein
VCSYAVLVCCAACVSCGVLLLQIDALLQTDFGAWAMRKARPLLHSVAVLIGPISASCQIAITTAKIAAKTALHGSIAMAKESFS